MQKTPSQVLRLEWLRLRTWQSALMLLFWPLMTLGTLYSLLFFYVNSEPFEDMVEAQLNALFMGQFALDDITLSPSFDQILLRGVSLQTPEGEHVVTAGEIEAKVDLTGLPSLLTRDQFKVDDIQIHQADVLLDFTGARSLNLVRALTPVSSSEESSDLSIKLANIDIHQSHIHLRFDDFDLDFEETYLSGMSIDLGPTLNMETRPTVFGDYGLRSARGSASFDPALFGFAQGRSGHPKQGLVFDSPGGRVGHIGSTFQLAAQQVGSMPALRDFGVRPLSRGRLMVSMSDLALKNYWWRDGRYGFSSLSGGLSYGQFEVSQPWMDLAPEAEDVLSSAEKYGHEPSGQPLEEVILYYLDLSLSLPSNDPLLHYFVGDRLFSHEPLDIELVIHGDFGRAEGEIRAQSSRIHYEDYEIFNLDLEAALRGGQIEIVEFAAELFEGVVHADGFYHLFRGDFDLNIGLGEMVADDGFARHRGLNLAGISAALAPFAGELVGALKVTQVGPELAVHLRAPLEIFLDAPLPHTQTNWIKVTQPGEGPLVALTHRVVRLLDDVEVEAGSDQLSLAKGFTYWMDADTIDGASARLEIGDIGDYLSGLTPKLGLSTRSLSVRASAEGTLSNPSFSLNLSLNGGRALEYEVDHLEVKARYDGDRIDVSSLSLETPLGNVEASGWVEPFAGALSEVRRAIPLDIKIAATEVLLDRLPPLAELDLKGKVNASARIRGTSTSPAVDASLSASKLSGFGERIPSLNAKLGYKDNVASIKELQLEYGPLRPAAERRNCGASGEEEKRLEVEGGRARAQLCIEGGSFHLTKKRFNLDLLVLEGLYLEDIETLKAQELPVRGQVMLELATSGELGSFTGQRGAAPLDVAAYLALTRLAYGERALGDITLRTKTEEGRILTQGEIFDLFKLKSEFVVSPTLSGSAALSFDSLDILEAAPELDDAVNGPPEERQERLLSELLTSGAVEATLSPASELTLGLRLDQLSVRAMDEHITNHLPLSLVFDPASGRLDIERFELVHRGKHLMLSGWADKGGEIDLSLNGEINVEAAELAKEVVGEAEGSLALSFHAAGELLTERKGKLRFTPHRLFYEGFVSVREPISVMVRGLTEPIKLERGLIDIAPRCQSDPYSTCFTIPAKQAFVGNALGGQFNLKGEIERNGLIPGLADLELSAESLSLRLQDEATLTFSPFLTFYADDIKSIETYAIGGTLEVTEGRYYKDFDIQSDLLQEQLVGRVLETRRRDEVHEQDIFRKNPALGEILLDLQVICESGLRIDNMVAGAGVNVDLAFQLDVNGPIKAPEIYGVIDLREGAVDFRGTEFELLSGGQITFNGTTDAALEITAQAEINTQSSFTSTIVGSSATDRRKRIRTAELAQGSQLYIITLSIRGTLSKPTWDLDSRPFLTDNNIYTLIFTGKTLEELSAGRNESPAMDIAVESIIAPFFEAQLDEILSAEQFKFLFSEGAAQFVYVQQVNRALRLAAGVSIRGSEGNEQAISSEYRFDDRWLIELTLQNTIEEEGKAPVSRLGGRLQWRIPLD